MIEIQSTGQYTVGTPLTMKYGIESPVRVRMCVIEWSYEDKLCQSFCIQQSMDVCVYVCRFV